MNKTPRNIDIAEYDYILPDKLIARHPLAQRDACRLLYRSSEGLLSDCFFYELTDILPSDAMLVYNDTRVINARIRMKKQTGAAVEIFCLEPVAPADYERAFATTESCVWQCLVGNSKKWKDGAVSSCVALSDGSEVNLKATREARADGTWNVTFCWDGGWPFADIIRYAGVIPIPPYLNRDTEDTDSNDYQTVFSRIDGSVAAPTAGLHFTDELLARIDNKGIARRNVTLHVGAGTFKPVSADSIGEHHMHSEQIVVTAKFISELRDTTRPVYAVGTTSVRTLESLYHIGCMISAGEFGGELPQWYWDDDSRPQLSVSQAMDAILDWLQRHDEYVLTARTRIMIAPGYRYRIVRGLITNFHQPKSTLLLLVSAMIGDDWKAVYRHAVAGEYRFLSYGDACLFQL